MSPDPSLARARRARALAAAVALAISAAAAIAACQGGADAVVDAGRAPDASAAADAGRGAVPRPVAAATTRSFAAVADARVEAAAPASNLGSSSRLVVDGSPVVRSYLRFDVVGLSGQVTSARLRLYVTDATSDGPAIHPAGSGWTEGGVTWNNQPGASGAAIADLGALAAGAWIEIDVAPLVAGDGAVGIALLPTSSSGVTFSSGESANPPALVVTTASSSCVDCPALPTAVLEADATVDKDHPTTRYGAATTIAADASPTLEGYLRFRVTGVAGPLASARLRLTVTNATGDAPALYLAGGAWTESTVTWNTRPPRETVVRADVGKVAVGAIAEYDLTAVVTADGVYTFALASTSTDGFAAHAREGARPPALVLIPRPTPPQPGAGFAFTAAGDHGSSANSSAVFDLMPANGDWSLSLGDLSYGVPSPETAWCDYVKAHVGAAYPLALLAGNHEASAVHGHGLIDNFVADGCLPNRLPGVQGTYGKEYYVDYPAAAPLLRAIAISPALTFDVGGAYDYRAGGARYAWTAAAIDGARAAGIPWVAVAMHKNCITMGVKGCEIGADLFNLLVAKRVDLVLQGHDHTYQRSKQLAHGAACAAIAPGAYAPGCVADPGDDGLYAAGAGTVLVIGGVGGQSIDPVAAGDAEAGYFARVMATPTTFGLVRIAVTAQRLEVDFVRASGGDFTDHFAIAK